MTFLMHGIMARMGLPMIAGNCSRRRMFAIYLRRSAGGRRGSGDAAFSAVLAEWTVLVPAVLPRSNS